jgi:peptidoglycan hydrolase-like protein with peptidoglycan-binding domain
LGTASPFWRDLERGDAGDDVRAIQAELKRLGYQVRPDGTYGQETADALQQVLLQNDALAETTKESRDVVAAFRRSDWIWIPSTTAAPSSCDVNDGSPVSENDTLATLEATVRSVEVATMPDELIPGARTLTIGDETVPVDENGVVSKERASVLQIPPDGGEPGPDSSGGGSTPSSPDAADGEQKVQAILRLTSPRQLWSVPASLLFGFTDDDSACLRTAESVLPVEVVGSRLGSSLVLPQRGRIGATAYVPEKNDHSCS